MEFGLDGASWQAYPDWQGLWDEGYRFMIWKVTGENNYINPTAQVNLQRAAAVGFVTGGYDWVEPQRATFLPTGEDAANDYLRTLDAIGAFRKGFLPAVDWETPEWFTGPLGRNVEPYMRRYFFRLFDFFKFKVKTYTAPYFLAETGGYQWDWFPQVSDYWIAAPGKDGQLPDNTPWPSGALVRPWAKAEFHQHDWYGTSPAVVGNFDRDRYQGTVKQLWALGWQGAPTPEPEVGEVQEPPADKVTSYINAKGELILVANMGGVNKDVLGTNWQDVGGSTVNDKGEIHDRTIRANEFLPWKRRA
jgi:hypothetical protein